MNALQSASLASRSYLQKGEQGMQVLKSVSFFRLYDMVFNRNSMLEKTNGGGNTFELLRLFAQAAHRS
jgi:hypothetical protein